MGKKDWQSRIPKVWAFGIAMVLWLIVFVMTILKLAMELGRLGNFLVIFLLLMAIVIAGGLLLVRWKFYNLED